MKKSKVRNLLKERAKEEAVRTIVDLAQEEGKTLAEVFNELMLEHNVVTEEVVQVVTEDIVQAVATGVVEQAQEDGKTVEEVVNEIVEESQEPEAYAVTQEVDGVHVRPVIDGEVVETPVEEVITCDTQTGPQGEQVSDTQDAPVQVEDDITEEQEVMSNGVM